MNEKRRAQLAAEVLLLAARATRNLPRRAQGVKRTSAAAAAVPGNEVQELMERLRKADERR